MLGEQGGQIPSREAEREGNALCFQPQTHYQEQKLGWKGEDVFG